MKHLSRLFVITAIVLCVGDAFGQMDAGNRNGGDRSGGGRGDRNGGGRGNRGGGGDRTAQFEGMLRRMDSNGNGMIDAEEVAGNQFIERMLTRVGIEPKYPIAITQISQAIANAPRPSRNGSGPPPGQRSPGAPGAAVQLGFAFGDANRPQGATPGLAQPGARSVAIAGPSATVPGSTPSTATTPASPSGPLDQSIEQKLRTLATTVIQKYDKNGDGKLDRDEWPNQGKLGTFGEANRSGGDFIVHEELVTHLTDYYRRQQLPLDSGELGDFAKSLMRRSGRFLAPKERLTRDMPEWFLKKDLDGDGQVTMAEYANDWTPPTATEFDRFDLNRDGVITAAECLKVVKQAAVTSR